MQNLIKQFEFEENTEYIKIHGLQRSGTNYLALLVNDNFENTKALINIGGWKHGFYCAPWTLGREVHTLTITKNPYAWLVSLYKYWKNSTTGPNLTNICFEDFLKNKAVFEESAGTPFLLRASNPIQHWNNMNYHWISIRTNTKTNLVVPYESLLMNTEFVLKNIGELLGLKFKNTFENCNNTCEPGQENPKISDNLWNDRQYYEKQSYLDEYNSDLIEFVNKQLDLEVLETLGYQLKGKLCY